MRETLRLWQGVMPDPRLPASDVQWMPETGARVPGFPVQDLPPIETCPRTQRPYCSDLVASLRERDNPFPTIDYRDWAARQGYAGAAPVASAV